MAHHHAHEDGHRRGHPHEGHNAPAPKQGMHMGWWAAIGLVAMIAALAVYALTVDESIIPGWKATKPQVPAAP